MYIRVLKVVYHSVLCTIRILEASATVLTHYLDPLRKHVGSRHELSDIGRCLHFLTVDDVPYILLGEVIGGKRMRIPMLAFSQLRSGKRYME